MQEKVVYFLGAGFSAPMGLPVMSDFLIRSKDLYLSNPDKYHHFGEVFKTIDAMHRAKSHYNIDLFNIEEILSLLEMKYYVTNSGNRELFIDYLRDVIEALTPTKPDHLRPVFSQADWPASLFGGPPGGHWRAYCFFVASLFNLAIQTNIWTEPPPLEIEKQDEPSAQYAVISLNYDMVLERCLDVVLRQCDTRPDVSFARTCKEAGVPGHVPLAKLHGSVDSTIVPPTWNKVAQPKEIQEAWKLAHKVLSEATQIRILGYSLPQTDSYVRYLLESATMEEPHLKNLKHIDVGCLNPDGSVQERYEEFLSFYRYRFEEIDISWYLWDNWERTAESMYEGEERIEILRFNKLEKIHHTAFK